MRHLDTAFHLGCVKENVIQFISLAVILVIFTIWSFSLTLLGINTCHEAENAICRPKRRKTLDGERTLTQNVEKQKDSQ